jgi:hypothetical protein
MQTRQTVKKGGTGCIASRLLAIATATGLRYFAVQSLSPNFLIGVEMTAIRFAGLSTVAMTGIAGLVVDARPENPDWFAVTMHAAFGATLLAMILMSFRAGRAQDLTIAQAQLRCRRLSRQVYFLLYGMVAVCGVLRMTAGRALSQPPEILREYFVYALCALLTIRVLTVLSGRRPRARELSPRLAQAEDVAVRG